MTEFGFYHLTRTGADAALPALLSRTLEAGQRALIRVADPARAAALDTALWQAADPWLPHATDGAPDPDLHPIWITTGKDAPNGARFLFLLDGIACDTPDAFTRVFDLFDGTDPDAVAAARARWTAAKAGGHVLAYWRQTASGWEKG